MEWIIHVSRFTFQRVPRFTFYVYFPPAIFMNDRAHPLFTGVPMRSFALTCTVLLITALATFAADEKAPADPKPEAPKEPKEVPLKIERADLEVQIETEGTIDAVRKKKIKIVPDEYVGPYTIIEMLPHGQTVAADATLFKLD